MGIMNEEGGKLEEGKLSLYLPFPRRCPGFALALIDNVFVQPYNPPFCFPSSYRCTLCLRAFPHIIAKRALVQYAEVPVHLTNISSLYSLP